MSEEWRPVMGFEGAYEVSSVGRVQSLDRLVGKKRCIHRRGRILKQTGTGRGPGRPEGGRYLAVFLTVDGVKYERKVHHLVLEAFVGPRPPGLECRHANDVGTDNRVENLSWGTAKQNARDKVNNGRNPMAARTHCNHGHEFTPENTVFKDTGWGVPYRTCLTCRRRYDREAKRRKRRAA